jgi:hypothetical protein
MVFIAPPYLTVYYWPGCAIFDRTHFHMGIEAIRLIFLHHSLRDETIFFKIEEYEELLVDTGPGWFL